MLKPMYCIGAMLLCTFSSCMQEKKESQKENINEDKSVSDFAYHEVVPAKFPPLEIAGFNFPEDSSTINKWVHELQEDSIYMHAWGIWTGLTSLTDQKIPGDPNPLRVFETWLTPEEMIAEIKNGSSDYKSDSRSNRANLKKPNQFTHISSSIQTLNDSIHESVAYSPAAAKYAIDNKIFMATTLYDYGKIKKKKEIPFFPNNAVTIKPVFKLLPTASGQTMFSIAAWNGTTDKMVAFPEQDWNSFVTIDITNTSNGSNGKHNLDEFIHYKLNEEDVHYFNQEFTENANNKFNAKPGDIAVLVGMHVGTREITNWTWQTFWWDANSDSPPAPSSLAIANMRPDELKGAARNYAMAVAYYMVNPNEPYAAETVYGNPNYAFNPYLEAGFGPNVFDDSLSFVAIDSKKKIATFVGVRTNCMSCHRMATINPEAVFTAKSSKTPYVGNAFIGRNDSLFKGQLLLDFAWSVQGNIDTTGMKAYLKKVLKQ